MAAPKPGVWGIDLGQCALKAIRLENIDGQVTATAFDYIEHPKILSQPDADPDQLTREALEQFLSRNKLQGDMVAISVPGQSGLARFVKLPPVEEKKIADIVRFEAKQQIPFPLEEVVWDFQKVGAGVVTDGFAMETEIGLFAMKRDMVSRYLQHFKDVNVEVHIVQMSPLALCNFVSYDLLGKESLPKEGEEAASDKKCVVALDIGTDNSNLVITDGEKIIWQRPIPLGGNHFTRALTKDLKLTFAKAEHLKRNAVKSPDLKKILSALKTVLNDFVGEVQRSLGYFTNTHRDAQIQYMVGLGNAFRLPGLQKFLQEKLQLEVRKLQGLERLTGEDVTAAPQFTENILSFGVAYGLALQGLSLPRLQTNLLPYEIRVERMVRAKKPWAAAAAAAFLIAAAGLTFGRNLEYQNVNVQRPDIKSAMDEADKAKKELEGYESQVTALKTKVTECEKEVQVISSGVTERFNWGLLFEYVNMALPSPDGGKLTLLTRYGLNAKQKYNTAEAKKAYAKSLERRFAAWADKKPKERDPVKEDKEIKENLIQLNVEGIDGLYYDDLADYFKKLKDLEGDAKGALRGMAPDELAKVVQADASLPKKGWVFEIRGWTQHKDGMNFVENTLMENLRKPEGVKNTIKDDMEKKVKSRLEYFWMDGERIPDPEPGKFEFIKQNLILPLLQPAQADPAKGGAPMGSAAMPGKEAMPAGGAAAAGGAPANVDKRSDWRPIGEIAGSLFSSAGAQGGGRQGMLPPNMAAAMGGRFRPGKMNDPRPGPVAGANQPAEKAKGARVPRTEFVILFVWREPMIDEGAATPDAAAAGANPAAAPAAAAPGAAAPKKAE